MLTWLALGSALIAAAAAILSAWLTNRNALRSAKDERIWAEAHALKERRLEAYLEINSVITSCDQALNYYGNNPPEDIGVYTIEVSKKLADFESVYFRQSLWMTDKAKEKLGAYLGSARRMSSYIYSQVGGSTLSKHAEVLIQSIGPGWPGFLEAYKEAISVLQEDSGIKSLTN